MASGGRRKIGILETGVPPPELEARFGRYPDMFRRLLGDDYRMTVYDAAGGELPGRAEDEQAYIVTGSPAGVYEDLPWIEPLKDFLRAAKGKSKLVGICFGHQLMAEAFGGRVEKSERGWGVGLHRYDVREAAAWTDKVPSFAVPASHQDQVVVQPPSSRILAASPFTPYGLIAYDDQPAMSFQCHPEFEPEFAEALIESRRERLPDPDAAIATLRQPNDRELAGRWIRRFLEGSAADF